METKKVLNVSEKPTLNGENLNYITKLQRAVDVTRKEIELLLEVESDAAQGLSNEELLSRYIGKLTELPHFKDRPDKAKAYLESLLQDFKKDSSAFLHKATELSQFLTNREKDLVALDTKYKVASKREEAGQDLSTLIEEKQEL